MHTRRNGQLRKPFSSSWIWFCPLATALLPIQKRDCSANFGLLLLLFNIILKCNNIKIIVQTFFWYCTSWWKQLIIGHHCWRTTLAKPPTCSVNYVMLSAQNQISIHLYLMSRLHVTSCQRIVHLCPVQSFCSSISVQSCLN